MGLSFSVKWAWIGFKGFGLILGFGLGFKWGLRFGISSKLKVGLGLRLRWGPPSHDPSKPTERSTNVQSPKRGVNTRHMEI